jgi:response regulator RpfG family c-di-GMP phosphodiesterase
MAALSHKILVVDDEPHILHSLERLLRRDGHDILQADSGSAALELLATSDVAVIICDQRMPHMTGDQVLARASELRPDAYRITLTGHTDLQAAQVLINQAHINQFLLKPWDDVALRHIVQEGIRSYEMIRENRRLQDVTREQTLRLEAGSKLLEQQVAEQTEDLRKQNRELVALQGRVETSLRDTVGVLVGTLEAHSPNLGIHCKRVAQLAMDIGSRLGMSAEELRDIEFAALLHDVGKIAQLHREDAGVQQRPVKARQAQMLHCESGYAILSHVGGFERIATAVRHQQECFDGSGAPSALKGSQIPVGSRIIAVANAYDRAVFQLKTPLAVSRELGKRILLENEGSKFDPEIVRLLLDEADYVTSTGTSDTEVQLSPRQLRPGMVLARPINNYKGLLLLKAEAVLTEAFVEHIQALSDVDPLLTDVFVKCESLSRHLSTTDERRARTRLPGGTTDQRAGSHETGSDRERLVTNPPPSAASNARLESRASPEISSGATGSNSRFLRPCKKVLIIDGSEPSREALTRELRSAGYDSACVGNGEQALLLVDSFQPDVAIADLRIPGMSSEELMGHLHHCKPDLPCIIIAGNVTLEQVKKLGVLSNVMGILVKPWDHQRLKDTIDKALLRAEARVEESV